MNRDDHLNNCAKYFGRLTYEVKALNAIGRFDINTVVEDFLIPILRVLFKCPDLKNQNEIQQNFPSVDLGCRSSKFSFQVTTDASSDKIVKTLEKFREHGLEATFNHIYVVTLTEKQASYTAKSLTEAISALPVQFNPSEHILDTDDLLSRIKNIETSELEQIEEYLASEYVKRDAHLKFREQFEKFIEFAQSKIEVEKATRKYIPSIFVETHTTKEQMRIFAHPLFFCRKVGDVLEKIDYSHLNYFLKLAKEPELTLQIEATPLKSVPSTFAELKDWLKGLDDTVGKELEKVGPLSWRRDDYARQYKPAPESAAYWSIARFRVENIASGITSLLEDAGSMLDLMRKKIFLVTGMAGQGKTNFVCDLVENLFRSFDIPCVFIPSRELNNYSARQRLFGFISNNRYAPQFSNIHEYLDLFNVLAKERGKPFLIVIDGINEVTALDEFSNELKDFCNSACQYDYVKVVITCRSEFFEEKYASIMNEPFSSFVHRVADLRSRMSDRSKDRLLESYLTHFKVAGSLSTRANVFLKNDLLLLRIFCERHEGHNVGHMSDVYKGDLFEDFLFRKIDAFPEHLKGMALPALLKIVGAMLEADNYSQLSIRDFDADEKEIVRLFMAEDVILRQEIAVKSLSGIGDLIISFTYDELRDFILAYKLIHEIDENKARTLQEKLAHLKTRPIFEGVYKYAYLLARKTNSSQAIAALERADGFAEHFALNVHLLPPAVQSASDVTRLKEILADTSFPQRVRDAVSLLINRQNPDELLNIVILVEHMNHLEADRHRDFIRVTFSDRSDFRSRDWAKRVGEFVEDFCGSIEGEGCDDYAPEWLAVFLHVSSAADWTARERVSAMFKETKTGTSCRQALDLIRCAKSETISRLLSDIETSEEASA